MIIQLENNQICILNVPKGIVGQISFWGFRKQEDGVFKAPAGDLDLLLEKLLDFLDTEKIEYKLSSELSEVRNERVGKVSDFAKRKLALAELKAGLFDKKMYEEFSTFLANNLPRTFIYGDERGKLFGTRQRKDFGCAQCIRKA
jgi:hypothetical protein